MHDEIGALRQALMLSKEIDKYPRGRLKAFQRELERLSDTYQRITEDIRAESDANGATGPDEQRSASREASASSSGLLPLTQPSISVDSSNHDSEIRSILISALQSQSDIKEAVWRFETPKTPTIKESLRALHIQNILSLQKRKNVVTKCSSERVLVLCACRSLALDFQAFEVRGGWSPKESQIIERILSEKEVEVQKIGKTVKNFVAAHRFDMSATQKKLEAALRFGIKLGVIDAVGREAGFNSLSLLLGLEFARLSRLSFSSLGRLRQQLRSGEQVHAIRSFASIMDPWWLQCQTDYHQQFGDDIHAPRHCNTGNFVANTDRSPRLFHESRGQIQLTTEHTPQCERFTHLENTILHDSPSTSARARPHLETADANGYYHSTKPFDPESMWSPSSPSDTLDLSIQT